LCVGEKNIKTAALLNIAFTILEFIGGIFTNSLAIISDALHDLGDSIILIISLVAERHAKKPADEKRTFGYQRISLLSSIFAALVLIGGSFFILSKAIPRLFAPQNVNADGMLIIAIAGIAFNLFGFLRLKKGFSQSEKILSWHFLEDVLGWVTILIGSAIIKFWGYHIIDPVMTIGFSLFVMFGVARNLKETFNIFLQGVPEHIDIEKLKKSILSVKGVNGVHDVHVWSLEGETDILTAHVIVDDKHLKSPDRMRAAIKKTLGKHHIEHSTIELESRKFCSGQECCFNNGKNP